MKRLIHIGRFNPVSVFLAARRREASRFLNIILQFVALITFVGAYRLFKASPFGAPPIACFIDEPGKKSFEDQMLEGVGAIRKKTEKLVEDYDRLSAETKTAFEELTKVKNNLTSVAEFETQLKKVNLALAQERRSAYGNPYARLLANEDARARINFKFREIAVALGDLPKSKLDHWKGRSLDLVNEPGSTYFQAGFLKELYDTLAEFGAWSTLGVRQMSTKITKMPVKTVRPIAYVLKPGSRTMDDDSNKAGTSVNLEVELIGVMITVYLELLQDSEFDLTTDVLDDFIEAYNYRLDFLAFMADGTDDNVHGGFTGAFNFWGTVSADATRTTVASFKYTDVLKCLTSVAPIVLARKARWWLHPTMLARMIGIQDLNGRPIFQTALEAPSYGAIGTIFGYPVTPIYVGPNTDSAGQQIAAFGDGNSVVVGTRQDFNFEASDDFKFDQFLRAFRGVGRAGVKGRRDDGGVVLLSAAS